MADIEQYEPYYLPPISLGEVDRLNVQCIEDRPPEDGDVRPADIQSAGSLYGFGIDFSFMHTAISEDNILHFAPTVALATAESLNIDALLHDGRCAGEIIAPDVVRLVLEKDPAELYAGIGKFGLNLKEVSVGQAINTMRRYAEGALSFIPSAAETATLLEGNSVTPLRRVPVVPGDHQAHVILSNLTRDRFDTRGAWNAGRPGFNISFGRFEQLAYDALVANGMDGAFNGQLLLAISALRHYVTAGAALRHPEPGKDLEILTHNIPVSVG